MYARSLRLPFALPLGLALSLGCGGTPPAPTDASFDANIDASHAAVVGILRTSCVFSSCHGGTRAGAAMLNLQPVLDGTTDLRALLVDQPSCEYSAMPLVTPGDPDHSWFMLKLDGPHVDRAISFTPDPTWDSGLTRGTDGRYPASICPITTRGEITFGELMPQGAGPTAPVLTPNQLAAIRGWILAGAPGP